MISVSFVIVKVHNWSKEVVAAGHRLTQGWLYVRPRPMMGTPVWWLGPYGWGASGYIVRPGPGLSTTGVSEENPIWSCTARYWPWFHHIRFRRKCLNSLILSFCLYQEWAPHLQNHTKCAECLFSRCCSCWCWWRSMGWEPPSSQSPLPLLTWSPLAFECSR